MLSALSLIASSALLYCTARILYNLFLHPLARARIPGPALAAATTWYETYFDLLAAPGDGGRFPWEIERLHRVYGPIVRIGPDEVHVDDPAWFDTFKPLGGVKRDRFARRAQVSNTPLGTFGAIEHDVHRARKMVLAPFYSKRAVAANQHILHSKAHELCALFRNDAKEDRPTQLERVYGAYSMDVICDVAMGFSEGVLRNPEKARVWKDTLSSILEVFPLVINFPWLVGPLQSLPLALMDRLNPPLALLSRFYQCIRQHGAVAMKEHREWTTASLKERSRTTVFHAILESSLPPHEKSLDRLEQEGRETLGAGGETTNRILCAATYYTLATPGVLERLQAELKEVVTSADSDPELSTLESLPWLTAIIKETLRHYKFVTTRQPLVAPSQTLRYDQWEIPPGTAFSVDFYCPMHDPALFPEPLAFRPERWLGPDSDTLKKMGKAFKVFGQGPRMCSGKNLAWAEAYVALAAIFGRFELELYDMDEERDFKIRRDNFQGYPSKTSKGVRVKVVREL